MANENSNTRKTTQRVPWRDGERRFAVDAPSIPWETAESVLDIRQCYLRYDSDARTVCIVARETHDRTCGCTSWDMLSEGQSDDEDMHAEEISEWQFTELYARRDKHDRVSMTRGTFRNNGVPFEVTVVDHKDADRFAFAKWFGTVDRTPAFPPWIDASQCVTDVRFSLRAWAD
jgi:hypothetical protein